MRLLFPFSLILATAGLSLGADAPPAPANFVIRTKPAQMKYDLELLRAAPGAAVTLTLQNEDDLPHNLVVCRPRPDGSNDKGLDVATQAWNLGEAGMKADWIPPNPRIIAHTKMVNPHASETIRFTAPAEAGSYPFVCTFPGHALAMNGTLVVSQPTPPIKNLHYRYFVAAKDQHITKLDQFPALQSIEEGQLPAGKMDIRAHAKGPKNEFAYEFEGALDCPADGEYQFRMGSDDGSQLWIDGKELIKIDGIHPTSFKDKKLKLTKGEHAIKVRFFQGVGGAEFYFSWAGPGFTETWLSVDEPAQGLRRNSRENFEGIPLVVTNEARIYRNFIAGSSPRGIAVGYPGGANLCWDADQMNLALVWQGAFIDAKRHWSDRGVGDQPPLGFGVAKLGQHRALALLASETDPWTPAAKKEEPRDESYVFRGYELDAQRRPTFQWDYRGVKVTESFEPSGDYKAQNLTLRRTLSLRAETPVEHLYFLALAGPFEPKDGAFIYDKTIRVTLSGGTPLVRRGAGGQSELLLPVVFGDGAARIVMTYSWDAK